MCDWLSSADWSDVQIVCGGRSFGAHKAVLASVSTFLKEIFLSCLGDEVPIYIILPEFDMEAMSFVLYYVYNGEVTIDKHKIRLFMEIINAMHIYLDCEYLTESNKMKKERKYLSFNHGTDLSTKRVFTLANNNENSQKIINIKKIKDTHTVILKCEHSETDYDNKNVRCQNESEPSKARLGNLNSPYCDRQRNSYLRDLFIETYPRNGNVNGRSEGVLAISNECYHSPSSVLSGNANGKHLDGNDAPLTMCNNLTRNILHSQNVHFNRQQISDDIKITRNTKHPTSTNTSFHIPQTLDFVKELPMERGYTIPSINSHSSLLPEPNNRNLETLHTVTENNAKYENVESSPRRRTGPSKVIFNQVLQGPWCSRKPNNYRPFRRKVNKDYSELKIEDPTILNDNNNNINQSTPLKPEVERIPVEERVPVETTVSNLTIDSFKCTYCNQIFTSREVLDLHLRRHSTNARYTCSECGKTFSQLRNFKYHMSIHRGTREFAATCTVCGKYFNDRGYLSSHMKIHRNRKEYKCSQCPKSFNQRVAYNMHVRIHTGLKPHVCDECGKAFSRKMLLKQHQRTHSGERPYACSHCDKRFADRSNMTLHLRLHTGVKPFSCSLCPKSFTKKHHLKSHLNFHTGSKPYSCPRCDLSFTQSSNMRTHYKKCNAPEKVAENETSPS